MRLRPTILFALPFFFFACATTKQPAAPTPSASKFLVAWWNVENLFDTIDDETQDDDFTPSGKFKWTRERLDYKFKQLSTVIRDLANDRGYALPDIMGFCEVEHQWLLDTLFQAHLGGKTYRTVYYESPDARGIDVGIAYDGAKFQLLDSRKHKVDLEQGATRDIVEAKFSRNGNVLHVFVNHWPSRRGGEEASEPRRIVAAQTLRSRIDEILAQDSTADVIMLGDLNDEPSNRSISQVLRATGDLTLVKSSSDGALYDFIASYQGIGTYRYQNRWERIDHAIVTKGLLDNARFFVVPNSFAVFHKPYMFERERDGKPTEKPLRTYAGAQYLGGYADHLPILFEIQLAQ
ncbi:MAG: endonuclease/exonuclease/phosphatase family protein [Chloroherpetonaceae bacterium]|nr:endonuclease/exonuclease/phosphatase family protein [Chloroherpetonaceae bacterium]MDW8437125.1 endonuclease/exonuclease/phosphatase family protein [Chloroherpetonaceae bacterium]